MAGAGKGTRAGRFLVGVRGVSVNPDAFGQFIFTRLILTDPASVGYTFLANSEAQFVLSRQHAGAPPSRV